MNALARKTVAFVLLVSNAGCMASTSHSLFIEGDATHADRGDHVQLVMADGHEITGTVGPSDDSSVEIETSGGQERVMIEQIRSMKRYAYKEAESHRASPEAAACMMLLGVGMLVGLGYGAVTLIKSFEGFKGFGY